MSPVWQQKKLREFCRANNIIVTAFSPLGAKGSSWGTNRVMENQVLNDIAKARGKTLAQVLHILDFRTFENLYFYLNFLERGLYLY